MAYYLKVNGSSRESAQTISITVDYDSAYVDVCWLGVITDESECFGDDVQTYCESIYIGVNDCEEKTYEGTIEWHDCVITYIIIQNPDPNCTSCDKTAPPCELIDYYVSPYYIPYKTASKAKVYYSYWEYSVDEEICEIIRSKNDKNVEVNFTEAETDIKCDADSRILKKSVSLSCVGNKTFDFYVQMPDNCCDTPSGTCYEISDVYYVDSNGSLITDVDPSGETIYFCFDYKKVETDDKCNTKTSFGRFDGRAQNVPWGISGCVESECCRISGITSGYTWTNHKSCETEEDIIVPLSIRRRKDVNYSGDCSNVCEPDTGYCVENKTVTTYYKDTSNGEWTPWGHLIYNETTKEWECKWCEWEWKKDEEKWVCKRDIDAKDAHKIPYYGGSMMATWEYSAITVYDDCTSGVTSGNVYEDIVDILPYSAETEDDCYDETKCYNVTLKSQGGNKCDGGHAEFKAEENTSQQKYVSKEIEYVFKKSPCEMNDSAKLILPTSLVECPSGETKCNEFAICYLQDKIPCNDDCITCVTTSRYKLTASSESSFTDSYSDCELILIDNPYWISIEVSSDKIKYTVEANKGSDREGGVTFQVNGMDCYDTVIIWQHGDDSEVDPHPVDPDVKCDCANATFEVYPTSKKLPSKGGSNIPIGSYIYDDCDVEVNVEGGTTCSISSSVSSLDCNGDVQFTVSSGDGDIPSWLSKIKCEDGFIRADVTKNTDEEHERTCNLTIKYSIDGKECTSKKQTLTVTQSKASGGGGCDISIEPNKQLCWEDGGEVTFTVK